MSEETNCVENGASKLSDGNEPDVAYFMLSTLSKQGDFRQLGWWAKEATGWEWRPGMLMCGGYRLPNDFPRDGNPEDEPDFSDAATLGCLVAIVRERADVEHLHSRFGFSTGWSIVAAERGGREDLIVTSGHALEASAWVTVLHNLLLPPEYEAWKRYSR